MELLYAARREPGQNPCLTLAKRVRLIAKPEVQMLLAEASARKD